MKPELLAPAGGWPSLRAAVQAGADAVYFGVDSLNMRATAKNFKVSELKEIVDYCKENKVKTYLTINTIIYDNELIKAEKLVLKAKQAKINAIICWDPSIIFLAKKHKIDFHISTQASVSNSTSAKFYKKLGAKRIILARELNLKQIKKISNIINTEVFIHGALCYSISGRCFFSQELYKKSANRGDCLQPCRRRYLLTDIETGKKIKTKDNHFLSPKDLCTLTFLDEIIKAKVKSLKIEGRNRSPEYVKTVTEVYREALDNPKANKKLLLKKLQTVYNRKFSTGFYLGLPTANDLTNRHGSSATQKKVELGKITNYYKNHRVAALSITANSLKVGDQILIIGNKTGTLTHKITSLEISKKPIKSAKKGALVAFQIVHKLRENDRVYKITKK